MRNLRTVMRDEMVKRDEILRLLQDGPKTVPEIARALNAPTADAVLWMMAMRRYGWIAETGRPNTEGYFAYALIKKDQP
ncbi:MAG: MarR family transcriptional regulator [candidate division FCPU426 bacterium]